MLVVVLQARLLLLGLVALLWRLAAVVLVLGSWAGRLLLLRVLVEVLRVRLLVTRLRWRVRAARLLHACLLPPCWSSQALKCRFGYLLERTFCVLMD